MKHTRYGTAFEELSDEERTSVSKKPKPVHEEEVKDERGRRRFHGAFTGGFSAGYFNTVGSKHGWVPQTFKSSRDERAEKLDARAEDFMDSEDLGEFGIAPQRLRTKRDFMETLGLPGGREQLAWERAPAAKADDLVSRIADIVKPVVNDSIGVRLLKKMGWRMGKGIGPTMSRRALERQKVLDAKSQGRSVKFDEKAVHEIEEVAPEAQFAPDDIPSHFYASKESVHGLGYQPLGDSSVLKQDFGQTTAALKTKARSKGIRGQAFGVGVYEDDDEDVYTNVDLSQYDYEIGAGTSTVQETAHFESTFVPAKKPVVQRKYFDAPRPPHGFRPFHTPIAMDVKHMPVKLLEASQKLTPFQRAVFLGDRSTSVLELLSDRDRERLKAQERPAAAERSEQEASRAGDVMPFEEEPMKAHRFKQYVHYLKRGLVYPQPVDLTRLEWEQELAEFKRHLTPELRALLPEVKSRQLPLAKLDLAAPIAEQLKSRFQKEASEADEESKPKVTKDHDRIQAVRMNMFGDMTRTKYEWHPAKDLCKRFNVTNPYPQSSLVGVLELQKRGRTDSLYNLGLPDTAMEMHARRQAAEDTERKKEEAAAKEKQAAKEEGEAHPPLDLLAAIFEESDASSIASTSDEEDNLEAPAQTAPEKPEPPSSSGAGPEVPSVAPGTSKVITVVDLAQDEDDEFGPRLPPAFSANGASAPVQPFSVLTIPDSSSEESSDAEPAQAERSRKKHKHKKAKTHKRSKDHKKEKKRKREKKRHRTRSP